jgi:hypothetical protein
MKRKMHYQIQPSQIQPREMVPSSVKTVQFQQAQVEEEIQNFMLALDSYPARVARDPGVSFQQHLCSFFAARNKNDKQ